MVGYVVFYILEDKEFVYQYWLGCVELVYLGCMNIMVISYELGVGMMLQDEMLVVYWYKEVVDIGIYVCCVGGFLVVLLVLL